MKSSTENQVQNLSEWLEIATKGLVAPAKQRISTEIEVHYAEAVDAHLKTGQGEADAQTAGLKELGDAKAASKGFRRRHLTEREAKRLGQIEIRSKSVSAMITDFWHFALVLYLARSVDLPGRRFSWCFALMFFACVLAPTTSKVLSLRTRSRSRLTGLVLMDGLKPLCLGLVFALFFFRVPLSISWVVGLPFAILAIYSMRLLIKVRALKALREKPASTIGT